MPRAEEGRSMTAKSLGQPSSGLSRGYPNGETPFAKSEGLPTEHIGRVEVSGGTETSKYPEEKKSKEIPLVAASETGTAQTPEA